MFVGGLILSIFSTWYVRNFANAKGWTDAPKSERHVHTLPVPRLGGVAIFFSFVSVVLVTMGIYKLLKIDSPLHIKQMVGLLGPACIVFLLGLLDDLYNLSPYWKFGVQVAAATWLFVGGYGIHNLGLVHGGQVLGEIYCFPLTILWVVLITNAFNLIDGLDGLAAGSALFSTIVVFVMSLTVPNPFVTFLTIALAGATLGFLRFNFHPATIFLGDSGSLFIGFMLAALALAGAEKAPTIIAVAIPIVSLGFPILDVALAVGRRLLSGKPLFEGDKHHIHHKLLKLGLSQRDAVLSLYAVTAAFGFLSLVLLQERRAIALVLAVMGIGVFLGVQQLRYQEFAELLSILQRVARRRQILANHVAIRQATEILRSCRDFDSICRVLKEALEPVGFDGVRFQKLGQTKDTLTVAAPLRYSADGSWIYSWLQGETTEPAWELKVELANSSERWGYFSLIRMCNSDSLAMDVNMLSGDFCSSLCKAIERATADLEEMKPFRDGDNKKSHVIAAGTMAE